MSKKKKEIKSQDEMFVKLPFKQIPIASFFYGNSHLFLKLNEEDYVRINPLKCVCEINEYNKNIDGVEFFVVDISYSYKRKGNSLEFNKTA
jgi:hypothetical protein